MCLWIMVMIMVSVTISVALMLLVLAITQKMRHKRIKNKEDAALKGVATGIGDRLHAACPGSKWRWVCRPAGFALNGGIARIEVIDQSKKVVFMDVCLSTNGYMALHVLDVAELVVLNADSAPVADSTRLADESPTVTVDTADTTNPPVSVVTPKTGVKPHDEESVTKWFNIVLIDALTSLIDDLNAKDEVCLYIGKDGKAHIEEGEGIAVVYDFGEMPDVSLWSHITDKLGEEGLFAEIQEGNCIFISWV